MLGRCGWGSWDRDRLGSPLGSLCLCVYACVCVYVYVLGKERVPARALAKSSTKLSTCERADRGHHRRRSQTWQVKMVKLAVHQCAHAVSVES